MVMALGALSIFIANVSLKHTLSNDNYYNYSVIITILTLLTSFGALGADQVFLRLSIVENKRKIIFDKKIIYIAIVNTIIMTALAYIYFVHIIDIPQNKIIIIIICFSSIWLMLLYNVLRLASFFLVSQIVQNSWKILFGVFSILIFFNSFIYEFIYEVIASFLFLLVIMTLFFIKKNVQIESITLNKKSEVLSFSFHFFLALLTLSFLSQGDRILIDRMFTNVEFGNYFYLATLFLFPFSLFQSYIGFKELVYIKANNINFKLKLRFIFKGSIIFSILLFCIIYTLSQFQLISVDINKDLELIFIFIIIGNIKMIYSLFSALIGAKATLIEIKRMNIIFVTATLILVLIFINYIDNIESLVYLFCGLWFIRLIIWLYFSKSHIVNES
ncbi:hypothetical protein OAE07_02750 [Winogradskyella sp.]|nr:hypothetical protein [Winogradskyella sp.]